jgi:hypothetical protein
MIILENCHCVKQYYFKCCEYPMTICDETTSDFEISNYDRVSMNIYQVHQIEFRNLL